MHCNNISHRAWFLRITSRTIQPTGVWETIPNWKSPPKSRDQDKLIGTTWRTGGTSASPWCIPTTCIRVQGGGTIQQRSLSRKRSCGQASSRGSGDSLCSPTSPAFSRDILESVHHNIQEEGKLITPLISNELPQYWSFFDCKRERS